MCVTEQAVLPEQARQAAHHGVCEHAAGGCPDPGTVCVRAAQSAQQRQLFRAVDGHHVGQSPLLTARVQQPARHLRQAARSRFIYRKPFHVLETKID